MKIKEIMETEIGKLLPGVEISNYYEDDKTLFGFGAEEVTTSYNIEFSDVALTFSRAVPEMDYKGDLYLIDENSDTIAEWNGDENRLIIEQYSMSDDAMVIFPHMKSLFEKFSEGE